MVNIFSVERSSQESRGFSHERFKEEVIDYIDDYKIVRKHKSQNNKPYNIEAKGVQSKVLNDQLSDKDDFDPIDKEEIKMYDVEYKNDIKLCQCKECGADAIVCNRPLMYWVSCSKCGFSLRYFLNEDDAIKAWNELNKNKSSENYK